MCFLRGPSLARNDPSKKGQGRQLRACAESGLEAETRSGGDLFRKGQSAPALGKPRPPHGVRRGAGDYAVSVYN
eukprot:4786871-Pleurochrysis_carterae.AAC.1